MPIKPPTKSGEEKAKHILFESFKRGGSFIDTIERIKREIGITQDLQNDFEAKWTIWNLFPYLNGIKVLEFPNDNR